MTAPRARTVRSLAVLGGGTALAAVLGLGFQSLLAYWFGASAETDAFFMSLSIYGFLGKFLMLSHLRSLALPVYARLRSRDPERARGLAGGLVGLTVAAVLVLSLLLLAAAPLLVDALAPGYEGAMRDLTVALVRIRVPALVFLAATTVTMAFLESDRRFGVTISAQKVVPAAVSLALLLAIRDRSGIAAVGWIGLAATVAGAALIFPAARARLGSMALAPAAADPEIRRIGSRWLSLSSSNAATFVGEWAFRVGASLLPVGLFSAVLYGRMTHDLLHAAINDSAQTVSLPRFAAAVAAADEEGGEAAERVAADADRRLGPVLRASLARLSALSLPLTLLAAATAPWTVALLFGRGRFLADGMLRPAAVSLALFMIGFFLQGLVQILFSAAFATHRPALINRAQLVGHLARAAALVPLVTAFSYVGLVGAQVAMNALILALLVLWAPPDWGLGAVRAGLLRPVVAAALPAALYWGAVAPRLPDPLALGTLGRVGVLALVGGGWLVVYGALAVALRLPEVGELRRWLRGSAAPAAAALVVLCLLPGRARAQTDASWGAVPEGHWSLTVLEWMEARGDLPAGASAVRPLPGARVAALLAGSGTAAAFDDERGRKRGLVPGLRFALGAAAGSAHRGGTPVLAVEAGSASSLPFAFLDVDRARVLRGGVGVHVRGFWAEAGRERVQLGGGSTGALVLNPAYLDGARVGTAVPVRIPLLGDVSVVAGAGPLPRYDAVRDPWWGFLRATARPARWIQVGLSRGVLAGGHFPGGSVAFDAKPYGPDEGSLGAADVVRLALGQATDFDDQVAALDVRVSLASVGLPLLATAELGWEDRDRSWGDPGLIAGLLWAGRAPLPVTLRYEYVAFGRAARLCSWCDTLPAFWYQHVRFQSGWRAGGDLLGHPLGGYGHQHALAAAAWTPGGALRAGLRLSALTRERWNLLETDRPGAASRVDGTAAWRPGRRVELSGTMRGEWGEGWGWSDWEVRATAFF